MQLRRAWKEKAFVIYSRSQKTFGSLSLHLREKEPEPNVKKICQTSSKLKTLATSME